MIKNIVFDMGNVLICYDTRKYIDLYVDDKEDGDLLLKEVFGSKEWLSMDRGVMTSEEAIKSICNRIPKRIHKDVEKLINNWHKDIPPYPEVEELVKRVKKAGYKVYLLSNTSVKYHQFKVNIPALRYFDGEFISADWKLLKPEKEIFLTFYNHFKLKPEECYFIDDSPANIIAANKTGMIGFVYKKDIDKLIADMLKNNIKI